MAREFGWSEYSVGFLPPNWDVGRSWRTNVSEGVAGELSGLLDPIVEVAEIIADGDIAMLSGPNVYSASLWARNRLRKKGWEGVQVVRGRDRNGNRVAYFRLNLN